MNEKFIKLLNELKLLQNIIEFKNLCCELKFKSFLYNGKMPIWYIFNEIENWRHVDIVYGNNTSQ